MENSKELASFYKSIRSVNISEFESILKTTPDPQLLLKKVGRFILMDRHRSKVFLPEVEAMGLIFPETVYKKSFKKEVERSSIGICLKYRNEEGIVKFASSFERSEMAPMFQQNLLWAISVCFDYKKYRDFGSGEAEYVNVNLNDYNVGTDSHRVDNAERKYNLVKRLIDLGYTPNRYAVGNFVVTLKKMGAEKKYEERNVRTNINGEKYMYIGVREKINYLEKQEENYKSLIIECLDKKFYPSLSQHEIFISDDIKKSLKKDARLDWNTRTLVCFVLLQECGVERGDQLIETTIRQENILLRENVFKFLVSYYNGSKVEKKDGEYKLLEGPRKSLDFLFKIVHSPEFKEASLWQKSDEVDKKNFIRGYWPLWTNMSVLWRKEGSPVVSVEELFKQMERVLEWSPKQLLEELKELSFEPRPGVEINCNHFLGTMLSVCMSNNTQEEACSVFRYVAENMEPRDVMSYFESIRSSLEPNDNASLDYKNKRNELLHAILLPMVNKIAIQKTVKPVVPVVAKATPSPLNLSRF